MDIRTKLILALVGVSIVSMVALGWAAYQISSEQLRELSLRQLNALAESRKDDLENVFDAWRAQVKLIRGNTQLRSNLNAYVLTGDRGEISTVNRILGEALRSVDGVRRLSVYDLDGAPLASVGLSRATTGFEPPIDDNVQLAGSYPLENGELHIAFRSLLRFNGRRVGAIEVIIEANELMRLARDYTGLGDTGEAIIAMREDADWVRIIHPLRHGDAADYQRIPATELSAEIATSLAPPAAIPNYRMRDYRGEVVWASTRYLDDLSWGLVVKIDEEEELRHFDFLRDSLIDLGLVLSAFAVVGGTLLGVWLSRPVVALHEVVHQFRDGNADVRANDEGDDEIAYLAAALNQFLDDYHEQARHLEADRDAELK